MNTDKTTITPRFLKTKEVHFTIATTDFCNARCTSCIWPYMESKGRVMNMETFAQILERLKGYKITEFGVNIINEPFTDKTILDKLRAVASCGLDIEVLYFTSNWSLPTPEKVSQFVDCMEFCNASPNIGRIAINATVSGIDQESYEQLQAGKGLTGTVRNFKALDFEKTSNNVCQAISLLSQKQLEKLAVFKVKAFQNLFTQEQMTEFWMNKLSQYDVSPHFLRKKAQFLLNEYFVTFARYDEKEAGDSSQRVCSWNWLNEKLLAGPDGELGLCCFDGLRRVTMGNMLEQSLEELAYTPQFQEHLHYVSGKSLPDDTHPCSNCEFYTPEASLNPQS